MLEPTADGFRNYFGEGNSRSPAEMLVEKADLLTLTAPEMTVLVGGMRALDANAGRCQHGVFTDRPGTLSNDFFVNLLDMSTKWTKSAKREAFTRDVIALPASSNGQRHPSTSCSAHTPSFALSQKSMQRTAQKRSSSATFVDAWTKVMTLDRF